MKLYFLIAVFHLLALSIHSQTLNPIEVEQRMDSLFASLNTADSPGAAVTVLQNGKVVSKKAYGMAHLEHPVPFTHKTPVRLVYSMGREFMSVGVALMEADGLLRFDEKVRTYFPELPEWSRDVTIQDLLNHSSGFDDEWSLLLLMTADMRSQVETEQVLTLLYNQPKPQIEPGKGYMYNNTDYALLRLIMEKASNQSLPDYLKSRLFEPLGMTSTFMNDDVEAIIPGLAENYYGYQTYRKARFLKFSPGGNYRMVTSANDLEKWAKALEDETSFLSKGFERLYKHARAIPVVSPERHYVFGHEWHKKNDLDVIYYGGVGDSFYMVRIPALEITVIGLGNAGNFIDPTMELAQSLLPSKQKDQTEPRFFPAEQVALTKEEMASYTGRYFTQQVGYNSHIPSIQFYDLKLEGDGLNFYSGTSSQAIPITSFGNGYFKDMEEDAKMKFTKSSDGNVINLEIWMSGADRLTVLKRNIPAFEVDKAYLQQFTGRYYSAHLDYYFRIVLNDKGQLIIKRPTVPSMPMIPDSENRFIIEQWNGGYSVFMMCTFTRNKSGRIDGFTLQDSRMMHHRFDKVQDDMKRL